MTNNEEKVTDTINAYFMLAMLGIVGLACIYCFIIYPLTDGQKYVNEVNQNCTNTCNMHGGEYVGREYIGKASQRMNEKTMLVCKCINDYGLIDSWRAS